MADTLFGDCGTAIFAIPPSPEMLELVKSHLRVTVDDLAEGDYIGHLTMAGIRSAEAYLGSSLPLLFPDIVPSDVAAAIFLIVGHLYANREAITTGQQPHEVPMGVTYLLHPHKAY